MLISHILRPGKSKHKENKKQTQLRVPCAFVSIKFIDFDMEDKCINRCC